MGGARRRRAEASVDRPVVRELETPGRAWSSSEDAIMQWSAHLWDVNCHPTRFRYAFAESYVQRWIAPLNLRQRILPILIAGAGREQ